MHLKLSNIQSIISSTILASSPIVLNRFIVHTHYSLVSAWIIFLSILLVLRKDFRFSKWIYLFIFSVLIHMYYFPFLVVIYLLSMFIDSPNWKTRLRNIQTLIYVFICTGFVMFVAGYFYGSTSSKDVGYGFFRSTLSSLIDPSGWSILIPDLPETEGSYEGFAFLGIPTLIILILNIFLFKKSKRDKSQFSFI